MGRGGCREDADEPILPLWSEREAAAKCAAESFHEYRPVPIGLEVFLAEVLPDMQRRGVWVGTNLTSENLTVWFTQSDPNGHNVTNITDWRRQRAHGELAGLASKKPGPKSDPQAEEMARLKGENEGLRRRLEQAELIIEVQKKVSQILGLSAEQDEGEEAS